MGRYLVVVERAPHNYAAYSPDLPGCVATGATRGETIENMRQAIAMHLAGLQKDGGTTEE
jgi:predicted RNase H-like HicB family nuclease